MAKRQLTWKQACEHYDLWNRAIYEHFVNSVPPGGQVFLSVDEEALDRIGKPLGMDTDDFLAMIRVRAVRRIGSVEVALDKFHERTTSGDIPDYVGFLAAMVLAADWMERESVRHDAVGVERDVIDDTNYFYRLRQVLGLEEVKGRPPGLNNFQEAQFWTAWNEWLRDHDREPTAEEGESGYRYISYPLSQSMLHEQDKKRLAKILWELVDTKRLSPTSDRDTLLGWMAKNRNQFPIPRLWQLLDRNRSRPRYEATADSVFELYSAIDWDADCDHCERAAEQRVVRRITAGLYREEDAIAGEVCYSLYPQQPKDWSGEKLEVELMRGIETPMFEQTRGWLAGDPDRTTQPRRKFFLIIDELHAYRGTPGTEVAYILRLLLQRLGLGPDSNQLQILTTSASVETGEKSRKFLRDFFGRDRFEIIDVKQKQPEPGTRYVLKGHHQALAKFAVDLQPNVFEPMVPPDPESDSTVQAMRALAAGLGRPAKGGEPVEEALAHALKQCKAPETLRDAAAALNDKTVRPTKAPRLDRELFPDAERPDGRCCSDAFRGLLLALALAKDPQRKPKASPQPVRGHLFFHNLQNLWVCCNPRCDRVRRSDPGQDGLSVPAGQLHPRHRIACDCGSLVLDLIVCEVCGEVFLRGYRASRQVSAQAVEILTTDQPDLERMPDQVSLQKRADSSAVFLPSDDDLDEGEQEYTADGIKRHWLRTRLNTTSGALYRAAGPPKEGEVAGWAYSVPTDHEADLPAMPVRCPRCSADYRRRGSFPSPLRNHVTGFQKACQVLAGAQVREMPPERDGKRTRKLVIFADSRQDAAKLAAGMERDHFRDVVRVALVDAHDQFLRSFLAFLKVTTDMMPGSVAKLPAQNSALVEDLNRAAPDLRLRNRFVQHNPALVNEVLHHLMGMPVANQSAFEYFLSVVNDYPDRVPLEGSRNIVWQTLLHLGQCPGGTTYDALGYRIQEGNEWPRRPWHVAYDWSKPEPELLVPTPDARVSNHLDKLRTALMSELFYALFPHRARSFEGLGQGVVTFRPSGDPVDRVVRAAEVVIRFLGLRRKQRYAEFFYGGDDLSLPAHVREWLNEHEAVSSNQVEQQLAAAKALVGGQHSAGLDPDKLYLSRPQAAGRGPREGARCPRCNSYFLKTRHGTPSSTVRVHFCKGAARGHGPGLGRGGGNLPVRWSQW
jgi:hypothetical protein